MTKQRIPVSHDRLQFASDNASGICPEAWTSLQAANAGHAPAYGEDEWTERACNLLREVFEIDCQVFFVYNGTAANSISLAAMCESYHSIICHQEAHLETDECGGPEFFSNGTKVLLVGGKDGKIDLDRVRHTVERRTDIHYPKPRVLSITQATEMGTVYSAAELDAVSETARRLGLRVHMDGARFANAVAALGVSPKEITWKVGVEVLCFGGTKNGMPVGDAIVFFDRELAEDFAYRCKQAGQLHSKMRFIAAPWIGLLEGGAWLEHARHANTCALRLASGLREVENVEILAATQANAVFAKLPEAVLEGLRDRGWRFYTFIGAGGARFMCSWQTVEDDIEALLRDAQELSLRAR
jgi:threonine aldolase